MIFLSSAYKTKLKVDKIGQVSSTGSTNVMNRFLFPQFAEQKI